MGRGAGSGAMTEHVEVRPRSKAYRAGVICRRVLAWVWFVGLACYLIGTLAKIAVEHEQQVRQEQPTTRSNRGGKPDFSDRARPASQPSPRQVTLTNPYPSEPKRVKTETIRPERPERDLAKDNDRVSKDNDRQQKNYFQYLFSPYPRDPTEPKSVRTETIRPKP